MLTSFWNGFNSSIRQFLRGQNRREDSVESDPSPRLPFELYLSTHIRLFGVLLQSLEIERCDTAVGIGSVRVLVKDGHGQGFIQVVE